MKLTPAAVADIKCDLYKNMRQRDIAMNHGVSRSTISDIATGRIWKDVSWPDGDKPLSPVLSESWLLGKLKQRRYTTTELAELGGDCDAHVERLLTDLQAAGHLVFKFGDSWGLEKTPPQTNEEHVYTPRRDGTYLFGFCGDTHLCSKYERLDVLSDLYDRFYTAGVDRVFHTGNWIDGEARFNMHDLKVHGIDQQIAYLVKHYPQRPGIKTYAVAGDDHEGWYGQRDGLDIGRHAEMMMYKAGRKDWKHLGYMEAFVTLQRDNASSKLLVMHPGGGSAYAYSYRPQKIVESFSGGEKPAVLLLGHYHKISHNVIRNVWAIQCGCTQDQTPFMRKKSIDAHVGGGICKLTQDAKGAITACQVEFFLYYNQGYYNNRWSHGGSVTLPQRGVKKGQPA